MATLAAHQRRPDTLLLVAVLLLLMSTRAAASNFTMFPEDTTVAPTGDPVSNDSPAVASSLRGALKVTLKSGGSESLVAMTIFGALCASVLCPSFASKPGNFDRVLTPFACIADGPGSAGKAAVEDPDQRTFVASTEIGYGNGAKGVGAMLSTLIVIVVCVFVIAAVEPKRSVTPKTLRRWQIVVGVRYVATTVLVYYLPSVTTLAFALLIHSGSAAGIAIGSVALVVVGVVLLSLVITVAAVLRGSDLEWMCEPTERGPCPLYLDRAAPSARSSAIPRSSSSSSPAKDDGTIASPPPPATSVRANEDAAATNNANDEDGKSKDFDPFDVPITAPDGATPAAVAMPQVAKHLGRVTIAIAQGSGPLAAHTRRPASLLARMYGVIDVGSACLLGVVAGVDVMPCALATTLQLVNVLLHMLYLAVIFPYTEGTTTSVAIVLVVFQAVLAGAAFAASIGADVNRVSGIVSWMAVVGAVQVVTIGFFQLYALFSRLCRRAPSTDGDIADEQELVGINSSGPSPDRGARDDGLLLVAPERPPPTAMTRGAESQPTSPIPPR